MDAVKRLVFTLEQLLNTRVKKHIVGGILLSSSIFLAGLAFTVITTKIEEDFNEQQAC